MMKMRNQTSTEQELVMELGISPAEANELAASLPPFAMAAWHEFIGAQARIRAQDAIRNAHPALRRLISGDAIVEGVSEDRIMVRLPYRANGTDRSMMPNARFVDAYVRRALGGPGMPMHEILDTLVSSVEAREDCLEVVYYTEGGD